MKKKVRIGVDSIMTILIPLLMAYVLVGEVLHEWFGIVIFVLFILHHILNFQWIKNIFRGKYNAVRILNLAVNIALFIYMFLQPITGIMMSKHLFPFFDFGNGISFARSAHLVVSYWGYLLMSIHLGFHMEQMFIMISRKTPKTDMKRNPVILICKYLLQAAIAIYGIRAFIKRRFADYLFMKIIFVFFDFSESVIWFLLDYLAVMRLFAIVGYYLMKIVRTFNRI